MISLILASLSLIPTPHGPQPTMGRETVELRFKPTEGTQLQKTFSTALTMESDELTSTTNGQPVPAQFLPEIEILIDSSITVKAEDTYETVSEGRPTRFLRSFETLRGKGGMEMTMTGTPDQTNDFKNEHDLQGEQVAFVWNPKTESYDRSVVDSDESFDDLELLNADMDLLGFLPEEAVSQGDQWEVEAAAITALLEPGGALGLDQTDDGGEAYEVESITADMQVTLKRIATVDGMKQALLVIEGEYTDKRKRPTTLDHIPVTNGTATETLTTVSDFEGEMIWNLSGGHAHSLELQSTFEITTDTVRDPNQPGTSFTSRMTFSGDHSITAEFVGITD